MTVVTPVYNLHWHKICFWTPIGVNIVLGIVTRTDASPGTNTWDGIARRLLPSSSEKRLKKNGEVEQVREAGKIVVGWFNGLLGDADDFKVYDDYFYRKLTATARYLNDVVELMRFRIIYRASKAVASSVCIAAEPGWEALSEAQRNFWKLSQDVRDFTWANIIQNLCSSRTYPSPGLKMLLEQNADELVVAKESKESDEENDEFDDERDAFSLLPLTGFHIFETNRSGVSIVRRAVAFLPSGMLSDILKSVQKLTVPAASMADADGKFDLELARQWQFAANGENENHLANIKQLVICADEALVMTDICKQWHTAVNSYADEIIPEVVHPVSSSHTEQMKTQLNVKHGHHMRNHIWVPVHPVAGEVLQYKKHGIPGNCVFGIPDACKLVVLDWCGRLSPFNASGSKCMHFLTDSFMHLMAQFPNVPLTEINVVRVPYKIYVYDLPAENITKIESCLEKHFLLDPDAPECECFAADVPGDPPEL